MEEESLSTTSDESLHCACFLPLKSSMEKRRENTTKTEQEVPRAEATDNHRRTDTGSLEKGHVRGTSKDEDNKPQNHRNLRRADFAPNCSDLSLLLLASLLRGSRSSSSENQAISGISLPERTKSLRRSSWGSEAPCE